MSHWHIKPQSDDEQGINKLQPYVTRHIFNFLFLMTSSLLSLYFSLRSVLLNNFFPDIKVTYCSVLILILKMFIQFVCSHGLLITLSDDIGTNPRPKPNPSHNFSICHWNVNSLITYNYLKGSLLRAYIVI